jgi:hypothetical protein
MNGDVRRGASVTGPPKGIKEEDPLSNCRQSLQMLHSQEFGDFAPQLKSAGDLFCTKVRQYPKEGCLKGLLVFDVVTQKFPTRIKNLGQEIAKMVLLPFALLERRDAVGELRKSPREKTSTRFGYEKPTEPGRDRRKPQPLLRPALKDRLHRCDDGSVLSLSQHVGLHFA